MKKLIVVLCVISCTVLTNASILPVSNSGFENGLTDWATNLIGDGSTIQTTSDSYDGSTAVILSTDWQSGTGVKAEIFQVSTAGSITAGQTYDLEMHIKGSMGTGGVAWAEIQWLNSSNAVVGTSGLINLFAGLDSNAYQLVSGSYVAPENAEAMLISIRCEGGAFAATNTLYVDMEVVPEPATLIMLACGSILLKRRQ